MAGSVIRARFIDDDVRRGLRAMRRAGGDLRPVLRKLRTPLRADLKEHAAQESGPGGKWPARQYRRRDGAPLLGKLPGLTVIRQRRTALIAENPIPWSAVHDEGGRVGRGVILPAREFVFMSEPFLERAAGDIADHVAREFNG